MMPTDFSAFHALEILKTFEIRSFFCEKWLLSHVFLGHKVMHFHASVKMHDLLTLASYYDDRIKCL